MYWWYHQSSGKTFNGIKCIWNPVEYASKESIQGLIKLCKLLNQIEKWTFVSRMKI